MSAWRRTSVAAALLAAMLIALPAPARADVGEGSVPVEVRVTSVTAGDVYLDVGRDAGLEPGDRVRLSPIGSAPVEAVVLSVSRSHARARLEGPAGEVDIGTRGEARVPAARLEEPAPDPGAQVPATTPQQEPAGQQSQGQGPIVPAPAAGAQGEGAGAEPAQQPEWTAPPEEWSEDMPLLAPSKPVEATEREVDWRGFVFLNAHGIFDEGRDYTLARTGVDLEAQNLFGQGGVLQLDIEAYARVADVGNVTDEDTTDLRLDRFSYLWGGDRERPMSLEGGRFLQRMMPEFGVLDGVEWSHRLPSGDRLGASFGFMPEWTPEMATGDDLQVAASWRHLAGSEDQLGLGLGVQKTWHEGEADRDLVVGTLDWRPDPTLSVHGSAWIDVYGSDELVKSEGVELTEAHLNATKRVSDRLGFSLFLTHLLWPDLLRNDYRPIDPLEIENFDNNRVGTSAWWELARKVRLSGRVNWWGDDEDDGLAGELRLGVRDRILSQGELALAAFASDGKFSSVAGGRLTASRAFAAGWWTLGWESALHTQDGFVGSQEELMQHTLRGSIDTTLGKLWDLSLWGDQRFGDEQQATTIGLSLRRRF